ncbi:reverse transcriptase domain-containing protein [Tanacetum coccineum]|uniref:Reverse transcriptase domain-containing protein n=1 Tax=Tanacetum coccineum TaxID=301880 RepID=A0ABQ5A8X6_9ASTR
MRTRRSNYPNSNVTIPRRRRRQVSNIVEPEIRTIVAPMAERTMEELLRAPTEGYGEAIVLPEINADHFEIKTNLLQLVQANPFYGRENDNPHAHINSFKRITSTLRFRNVPNDVIKLMMFPYSLGGAAKTCYEKEPPNSILTWEDLVTKMNATSSKTDERINKLADQLLTLVEIVSKNVPTPAPVKAVEESCVTCGGAHSWYNFLATDNNQASVCATTASTSVTLPSNTIPNPKGEMKVITTRSGVVYEGPSIPTNPSPKKIRDGFTLLPRFGSSLLKSLLMNKEKLLELAKIPLNENCLAMLLKKLPKKIGDPDKFLIPCNFPRIEVCHALADLGASINLMPLSIWKKLSLPELTPTLMTIELADRSNTYPKGLAEDVFVKVGKFHFPTDFVVVDFEADPRVPLILGRSFLRTGRALIDVYGEEITIRVDKETEYAPELLGFPNSSGGNPTSMSEPFTSEFILEEIEAYLKDD